jgi:hypothetical protein
MAEEDKPSLIVLRSHIGWPAPDVMDTAKAHGDPLARGDRQDQGDPRASRPTSRSGSPTRCSPSTGRSSAGARSCGPSGRSASTPGRATRRPGTAGQAGRGCRDGRRSCPPSRPASRWPPAGRQRGHQRHRPVIPGLMAGRGRPDREQRGGPRGPAPSPVARHPGGQPDPLRDPRARHGRGDERHGPARRGPARRRDLLRLQRLHAGPSGWPRCPRPTSSTRGPTTRSGLGEDGPTHQPIEQLAAMRAMPGLRGDPSGRRQRDGPRLAHRRRLRRAHRLILSRQNVPVLAGTAEPAPGCGRAATCWSDPRRRPAEVVLVGTGSEVQLCVAAAAVLLRATGSGPGWCRCRRGTCSRTRTPRPTGRVGAPPGVPHLAVEAAASFGWDRYADASVSIDHFGASAPGRGGAGAVRVHPRERGVRRRARRTPGLRPRRRREPAHDHAARPLRAAGPEPVARQPPAGLPPQGKLADLVDRRHPGGHLQPDHLRQGHRGRGRLRRAVRRAAGWTVEDAYWELVITDITDALAVLRPSTTAPTASTASSRSRWPGPGPRHRGTVEAARQLHERIDSPTCSSRSRPPPRGSRPSPP